jgi:hypothetical protein
VQQVNLEILDELLVLAAPTPPWSYRQTFLLRRQGNSAQSTGAGAGTAQHDRKDRRLSVVGLPGRTEKHVSKIRILPPVGKANDFDAVARLEPFGVDASRDLLSSKLIARCHTAGIKVFSDALGEHERVKDYLQAMRWGIDGIQTDHPLRVFRAIEMFMAEKRAPGGENRGSLTAWLPNYLAAGASLSGLKTA